MPVLLRSAAEYYRRARLLADRSVREARNARRSGSGSVARSVLVHQVAGARLARSGMQAMLMEQRISAEADALLNSAAFTTEVARITSMLDATGSDYEFDRLVGHLTTDALRAAEDVQITATPSVTSWVRHLVPPSCARCVILAGRVYRWSDGFERHPECDCIHVPTDDASASDMAADVDDLISRGMVHGLSKAEMQAVRDGADLTKIVNVNRKAAGLQEAGRALTREGRLTPAAIQAQAGDDRARRLELLADNGYVRSSPAPPPTAGGNAGGSGRTPPPPTPPQQPDPPDDDLAAWRRRQDAVPVDFKGDALKPWEVRTVERLVARGEVIDWIADDRTTSTADFDWSSRGVPGVEMKATKARISTIRGRILDAASRARLNHGVTKDVFLIDIGFERLTDQLRRELEKYNFDQHGSPRQKYRLSRLFVMSENGAKVDEIDLET